MINILITGGLGYIGSHTCSLLIKEGYNIYILDSLKNSSILVLNNLELIKNSFNNSELGFIKFFQGDIRDSTCIKEIFNYSKKIRHPIDIVFHFAGLKSVKESALIPKEYMDVNINGTKTLIKEMNLNGCKNIIFSSSATVYGNKCTKIIREDAKINPTNIYGETKAYAEELLYDTYLNNKDWRIINLRYFNPIGAHKTYLLGEESKNNYENLFPIICRVAKNQNDFVEIYGNNWDTKDGTCIRDYIHILDIARGHLSALNYIAKNKSVFSSINLGTSKGSTVLELINTFEKATKTKINYVFTGRRKGDVASYVASNDLAKRYLNWTPLYSLNEMCLDGWNWYLKSQEKLLEI